MRKIKISDYLIQQLNKLQITEIFGLPGDYNFELVEAVERNKNVNWIGSSNELNGAYCADGYARQKGYGAMITTFGVGELSAINGIAGSMAENVPVMKITGIPSTKHIENKTLLHHNLDNADYQAFYRVYQNVVEASAFLTKENAKSEIDRLINVMVRTKKPVYAAIPMDVAVMEIENINNEIVEPVSDEKNLNLAVDEIIKEIKNSKKPVVIADILARRFGTRKEVNEFLEKTKIPSTCFIRGLDVIKNDCVNYFGCYMGKSTNKDCYDYANSSDCVICFGDVISDLNTMGFDFEFDLNEIISVQGDFVKIRGRKIDNVLLKDVIKKLAEKTDYISNEKITRTLKYSENNTQNTNEKLTTSYLYPRLEKFLKENDIFINEVGLTSFGVIPMHLKNNIDINNQMLWGSIGWATPCAFGCAIADRKRRTILITGDGAHQLTAQEISTMMRNNVKPIIFIINNDGYTVERILCDDIEAKYNEIAAWNYAQLPKAFKGDCFCAEVKTNKELDEVLQKIDSFNNEKMCYIELHINYLDIPKLANAIVKHPEQLAKLSK